MTTSSVVSVVTKLSLSASTTISLEKELRKPEGVPYQKRAKIGRPTNVTTTANNRKTIRNQTVLLNVRGKWAFLVREDDTVSRDSFKDCISLSRASFSGMLGRNFDFLEVLRSLHCRGHPLQSRKNSVRTSSFKLTANYKRTAYCYKNIWPAVFTSDLITHCPF